MLEPGVRAVDLNERRDARFFLVCVRGRLRGACRAIEGAPRISIGSCRSCGRRHQNRRHCPIILAKKMTTKIAASGKKLGSRARSLKTSLSMLKA
jgi:hypothetical protein